MSLSSGPYSCSTLLHAARATPSYDFLEKVLGGLVAAGYPSQLLGGASVATSIGWFGSTGPSLVWTSRGLVRVASSSDSTIAIVHNSRILGFSRVGRIDMRAQVEMPSARRSDTPA
jgi:hypothetical protein